MNNSLFKNVEWLPFMGRFGDLYAPGSATESTNNETLEFLSQIKYVKIKRIICNTQIYDASAGNRAIPGFYNNSSIAFNGCTPVARPVLQEDNVTVVNDTLLYFGEGCNDYGDGFLLQVNTPNLAMNIQSSYKYIRAWGVNAADAFVFDSSTDILVAVNVTIMGEFAR